MIGKLKILDVYQNVFRHNKIQIIWISLVFISMVIGFLVRYIGINDMPISIDEYLTVTSIENIFKYGLPQFETGGYYIRGILYQYIQSFILLITGSNPEVSFRAVNIFFSFLAIPAIYRLGKKISGPTVGYLSIILFCFSTWEIEFSRYIRWMVLFQTIFIWYISFLYDFILEGRFKDFIWMHILSLVSLFTYEQAIFLLLLNFTPYFVRKSIYSISKISLSSLIFVFGYFYLKFNFFARRFGVNNYLPEDVDIPFISRGGQLIFPDFLISTLLSHLFWSIGFLILVGVFGYYFCKILRSSSLNSFSKFSLIFLSILSLLNQYTLIIILFLLLYLVNWISEKDLQKPIFKSFYMLTFFVLIFWFFYLFFTNTWFHFFENTEAFSFKRSILLLFKYPDFDIQIFQPFFRAIPFFTIFSILILGSELIYLLNQDKNERTQFFNSTRVFLIVLIFLSMVYSCIGTTFEHTKYLFFLFPVILIVILASMKRLAGLVSKISLVKTISFFTFLFIFLVFGEDFDVYHLQNMNNKNISLRLKYDRYLAKHYIRRKDLRTPAEIVNNSMGRNDIVITTLREIDYYLSKLDYVFEDYANAKFQSICAKRGKIELWTNSGLIYKESDLFNIIENSKSTVWLLVEMGTKRKKPYQEKILNRFRNYFVDSGSDKRVFLYKIPPSV